MPKTVLPPTPPALPSEFTVVVPPAPPAPMTTSIVSPGLTVMARLITDCPAPPPPPPPPNSLVFVRQPPPPPPPPAAHPDK